MFDDGECSHEIESIIFVWQLLRGSEFHRDQTTFATEVDGLLRDVDAFRTPVPFEHLEIRARATPNVENSGIVQGPTNLLHETVYDSPPSDIPPVTLLNPIKDRIVMRLHLLRQLSGERVVRDSLHRLVKRRRACCS